MKKLIFGCVLVLSSCDSINSFEQEYKWGCHRAVNSSGEYVYLHCCTDAGYVNEPNYNLNWSKYTDHTWTASENCQCK